MRYIIIACIAVLILAMACSSPSKYHRVPVEYCNAHYTGRTTEVQDVTYVCYAYDSNMNCTYNAPQYSSHTEREIVTDCSWAQWK